MKLWKYKGLPSSNSLLLVLKNYLTQFTYTFIVDFITSNTEMLHCTVIVVFRTGNKELYDTTPLYFHSCFYN